jgi:putative redox protein
LKPGYKGTLKTSPENIRLALEMNYKKNNYHMETLTDKSKVLHASVKLVNDKLKFAGLVDSNDPVSIDYIAPLGDDSGYTSLELLLLSLDSCIGSAVLTFLRKMKKTVNGCEIHSTGIRNVDHPTGFKHILLNISISSPDVTNEEMNKVIQLSEDKYCPVWAMLRGNVAIEIRYTIGEMVVQPTV